MCKECLTSETKERIIEEVDKGCGECGTLKRLISEIPTCTTKSGRKPSEYNLFMRDCVRSKKYENIPHTEKFKECVELWKKRKKEHHG